MKMDPRISITGYIGHNNVGDEAMLASLAQTLKDSGVTKITISSASPLAMSDVEVVPEIPGSLRGLFSAIWHGRFNSIVRTLRQSNLLVVAGGTILTGTNIGVLYFWLFRCILARLLGCRILLLGVGVDNLDHLHAGLLANLLLTLVDGCSIRDAGGWEKVHALAFGKKALLSGDLSLAGETFVQQKQKNHPKKVGFFIP